jgi:hypothetical protein
LPTDVRNRLERCRSTKDDISILTNCYYNHKLKGKPGFTIEDALIHILELLDSNSQYFDLTKDEYDDILYSATKLY